MAQPAATAPAEQAIFEQRGIEPVPPNARFGTASSQFRIWFGANAVVSSLFLGALGPVAFGLDFWSSLTAIAVGTVVSASALGFASTLGPRTGMVQILFARFTFGYRAGRVLAFFNALYCYAWSAVNLVTGTAALRLAFNLMGIPALGASGYGTYALWVLVNAAITTAISVVGYNLVHRWEAFSTYASLVVFAILTLAVLFHTPHSGTTTSTDGTYWKNWLGMALVSFGFGIGWIPYVSDYSRKLPTHTPAREVFLYGFLGLSLSAIWVESLGALISTTAPGVVAATGNSVLNGIPVIVGNNGLVVLGLLIIGLSTVSNNIPNDYTGGLSLQAAGIHVDRWLATLIGGILSALGALIFLKNFATKFQEFLLLLAYWVGAWFVLILYDYVKRKGVYKPEDWDNPAALPRGTAPIIAFVAALGAAWLGMFPGPDVSWDRLGQGLLGTHLGVDLGFVLAIATALLTRLLLDVVLPESSERASV
jgi:NCS1 nucleoside transporter family